MGKRQYRFFMPYIRCRIRRTLINIHIIYDRAKGRIVIKIFYSFLKQMKRFRVYMQC